MKQSFLKKNLLIKNQIINTQIFVLRKSFTIQNLSLNYYCLKKSYNLQVENAALREYISVNKGKMAGLEGINVNWCQIFPKNGLKSLKKKLRNIIIS